MASFDMSGHSNPNQVQYTYQLPETEVPEDEFLDVPPEFEGGAENSGLGRMLSILGAAGSLALVVGIGVWGYKLVMRDVSGVPVVRALEGPMRIQPEKPGGTPADHQGLAVNTVAAQGTAAPPADRLVLAPKPVSLNDEDAPMSELQPIKASLSVDDPASSQAPVRSAVGQPDAILPQPADNADSATASPTGAPEELDTAVIEQPEPLPIDPADLVADQPQIALLDEPGVTRSLRPLTRPARSTPTGAKPAGDLSSAINAAVESATGLDVDAADIPVGTRLAQLGAYDSPEIARAEWDRLYGRFGDYMEGKQRVVQKASSGGRTFYRLRAMGFDDMSDARRFCSALVAERADCIPVTVR